MISTSMKRLLLVCLASAWGAGCSVDPDEKDFFYRGWVNPNEKAPQHHFATDGQGGPGGGPGEQPIYKKDPLLDE